MQKNVKRHLPVAILFKQCKRDAKDERNIKSGKMFWYFFLKVNILKIKFKPITLLN